MRKICFTLILAASGLLALTWLQIFQSSPALAAVPTIDNDEVTVWDILLNKGDSAPATPSNMDTVVMFLEGGTIRTTSQNGRAKIVARKFGDAVFESKGQSRTDTLLSGGPAREIVVALKNPAHAVPDTGKNPLAFPRPGSVKVFENDRVIVWHYSWVKGRPTPMHFHDKDVVVAYRYDGTLRSITPDGQATDNAYKKDDIRFNKSNRTHSEVLTTARQSAAILELK